MFSTKVGTAISARSAVVSTFSIREACCLVPPGTAAAGLPDQCVDLGGGQRAEKIRREADQGREAREGLGVAEIEQILPGLGDDPGAIVRLRKARGQQ
ncbi:hypothetical protein [Nocardia lijiangensis]|uniref:hypothetical protein n=1 Tax=Nocardia lijiangensis TaxID=299618 RepID=UPI001FDFED3A|nr:hypothetical protein [Nocardia lijiangensis]